MTCRAIHSLVGDVVTPTQRIRLRSCRRIRRPYNNFHEIVGTTKRSIEAIPSAWLRRNVLQPCDGGRLRRAMYLATEVWPTSMPSLRSSPWMRGAPQSGADHPDLAAIVEPLLIARRVLREQLGVLHRRLLAIVRQDDVCRRLMSVPGVGPLVALAFRATVDVPARFKNSKAVGAVFGLTPRRHQSGEIDRIGGISKCGDAMMRRLLFDAAHVMMTRTIRWSWLKAWGMKIARHRGMKRAVVAVARRMAVIMHRMWADGTEFHWTSTDIAAA